jgi:hypothetical protein
VVWRLLLGRCGAGLKGRRRGGNVDAVDSVALRGRGDLKKGGRAGEVAQGEGVSECLCSGNGLIYCEMIQGAEIEQVMLHQEG